MKLLELLSPKKKEKKGAPVLEEIQPSVVEKMSEKRESKNFLDVNPNNLAEVKQKKSNASKSYDTAWEKPEYHYKSSSGVSGSAGVSGTSGPMGVSGSTYYGTYYGPTNTSAPQDSFMSGATSVATHPSFNFRGDGSLSTSWNKPKKNASPIVFKINSHNVENDPDLILVGHSKVDGFPIYKYTGMDQLS